MPEIHLRISGKVQGVGYRWFVRARAVELGVSGWVRNTRTGEVELAARGDSAKLELFESAVRRGPKGASVTAVHREPAASDASYPTPFQIER